VMKGSPLAPEVQQLMAAGGLDPVVKRTGNTVMGYYPMKLAAGCVACHAQNGLKQTEGAFGGALVAEIPVR
jgi:mono/diheme cytochrome c family protein